MWNRIAGAAHKPLWLKLLEEALRLQPNLVFVSKMKNIYLPVREYLDTEPPIRSSGRRGNLEATTVTPLIFFIDLHKGIFDFSRPPKQGAYQYVNCLTPCDQPLQKEKNYGDVDKWNS